MNLTNTFDVPASVNETWDYLFDVPRVVPCMPGAELIETVDERTWKARMRVKLGPVALEFDSDVVAQTVDIDARTIILDVTARELRGRGGASAQIRSELAAAGNMTRVLLSSEVTLSGSVAQYGRGVLQDVAAQLIDQFADCIRTQLADRQPLESPSSQPKVAAASAEVHESPPAVGGLRLLVRALRRSMARALRRYFRVPRRD